MLVIHFKPPPPSCMKIVVASVMEMIRIFQKHMDPEITPDYIQAVLIKVGL